MRIDSAGVTERSIRFAGIFAGACLGLVAGAVVLGISISGGSVVHAVTNAASFLVVGALFLFPLALIVGMPGLRFLQRRSASRGTTIVALWAVVLLVSLATTFALGVVTGSPFNSGLAVFPAAIWCAATGTLGGIFLSTRGRASVAIIVAVVGLSIAAALTLVLVK